MKKIFYAQKDRRGQTGRILLIVFLCMAMYTVDVYLSPGYFERSLIKGVLFLLFPILYGLFHPGFDLFSIFRKGYGKNSIRNSLFLGIGVYALLIGLYVIIRGFLDMSAIETSIISNMEVDRNNFVIVALYISFFNSLMEEFFFRGFSCLKLGERGGKVFPYLISSGAFALYHLSMVRGWSSPLITFLAILGLFLSGIFFNLLNDKNKNIYNSYMVHMFANFAINTLGLQMFGIIDLPFLR